MHFGKTPFFTLITLEEDEIKDIEVIECVGKHKEDSEMPAEIILNLGVDLLKFRHKRSFYAA